MKKIFLISPDLAAWKYSIEELKDCPDVQLVGTSSSLARTAISIQKNPPDVILMDLEGMDSIEVRQLERVRLSNPGVKILLLAASEMDKLILPAIKIGANGCILKNCPPEDVLRAIRVVYSGDFLFAPPIAARILGRFPGKQNNLRNRKLSIREGETLGWFSEGYRYKEIAEKMGVSVETVRTYSKRIFNKLEVRSRLQAVIKYQS